MKLVLKISIMSVNGAGAPVRTCDLDYLIITAGNMEPS